MRTLLSFPAFPAATALVCALAVAPLESLVAAYPHGFALPAHNFRAVSTALARSHAGWCVQRDEAGCVRLVRSRVGAGR